MMGIGIGVGRTVPQPNMAVPGTGELTFTFLGEAGVCGRAAMLGAPFSVSCPRRR